MPPVRAYDKAPYPAKHFGTRGLSLPYSRNIGPFNDVNRPANQFDQLALHHDQARDFRYFQHNPADERLLRGSLKRKADTVLEGVHKRGIEYWHKFKKSAFPWSDDLKVPFKLYRYSQPWQSVINVRGAMRRRGARSGGGRTSGVTAPRVYARARFVGYRRRRGFVGRRRRRRFARS